MAFFGIKTLPPAKDGHPPKGLSSGLGWPAVIANMAFLNIWRSVIPLANEVSHFTVLFGRQPSSIWVVVTKIPN